MTENLRVSLLSPSRVLANVDAKEVVVPGYRGYLGILPGHASLVSELKVGKLEIKGGDAQGDHQYFVSGGYVEVFDDNVNLLVDVVERIDEIDPSRAQEAEKRAEERLDGSDEKTDIARALASLERAKARRKLTKM